MSQLHDGSSSTPQTNYSPFSLTQQQQQVLTAGNPNDAFALPQDSSITGAGAPSLNPSGSALIEFTKRRNWSQLVLDELRDLLHILMPDGASCMSRPSARPSPAGSRSSSSAALSASSSVPDDSGIFVKEFNDSIASYNPLRFFYRFRKSVKSWAMFEVHGHLSNDPSTFAPPNTMNCRRFIMMARPYPTKNAALLDSFLEHKIENERLMKRIAELGRDEQEETEAQERYWQKETGSVSSVTPSITHGQSERVLNDYALIIRRHAESALGLHGLVHRALRGWLQKQDWLKKK
ncbi:Cutinase gene palindrome-binding protein [Paraphaeosphaeria sporulosa]